MSEPVSVPGASRSWRDDPAWPDVDVVMPILNEAAHLREAVAAVRRQEYPGSLRVHLAVGPSTDGTENVARSLGAASDITVFDNPSGKTPAALNLAIAAGRAPVVVRVDGHSQLSDDYISRAVETLRRTGAGNVGGRQVPVPTTTFEAAVADATTSWLGTGGAAYRVGGQESSVDTVYLGVFDRDALESVGCFDERLIRNQDYELNIRLRKAGYDVVFDPALSVGYTPRGNWKALSRQYFEYGRWKAEVLRLHPDSLKVRQLVPAVATVAVLVGLAGAVARPRLAVIPTAYAAIVVGSTKSKLHALVLATTHLAWGLGLVTSAGTIGARSLTTCGRGTSEILS